MPRFSLELIRACRPLVLGFKFGAIEGPVVREPGDGIVLTLGFLELRALLFADELLPVSIEVARCRGVEVLKVPLEDLRGANFLGFSVNLKVKWVVDHRSHRAAQEFVEALGDIRAIAEHRAAFGCAVECCVDPSIAVSTDDFILEVVEIDPTLAHFEAQRIEKSLSFFQPCERLDADVLNRVDSGIFDDTVNRECVVGVDVVGQAKAFVREEVGMGLWGDPTQRINVDEKPWIG